MGNAAVAEELPGADELDELYRLDASESGPEDDDGDENEDEDDDGDDDGDGDGGGFKPGEIPHP
jgi:hypothetical protein